MPAKPGRQTSKARMRNSSAEACLYLGCFRFDEPGEREQTGTFQVVVEAAGPEQAVERCRSRLKRLHVSTTLFNRPTTIFLDQIIKLSGSFENGLLVNWESGDRPPPPDPRLMCAIPEQDDHGAESYGLRPSKKGEDEDEAFLDFGGETLRRALRKAKGENETERSAVPSPFAAKSRLPLIRPVYPRTMPTDSPPSKETVRAQKKVRKERRAAIATTLDELRGRPGTSLPKKGGARRKRV